MIETTNEAPMVAATPKAVEIKFSTPDEWTIEHYVRFQEARDNHAGGNFISQFVGVLALVKAGFVKVECDHAPTKAKIVAYLALPPTELRAIPLWFVNACNEGVVGQINMALATPPNY